MSKQSIRQAKHNVFVVDADGVLLVSVNGVLSCDDKTILDRVRVASDGRHMVKVAPWGKGIEANLDGEPMNVLAALMSAKNGRSRVLEAPVTVMNFLQGRKVEKD